MQTDKLVYIDFTQKDFEKVLEDIKEKGNIPMMLYVIMHNQAVIMQTLQKWSEVSRKKVVK
jgi:dihydrodipicolinate synthase/N-acetylneuraminate lyase